MRIVFMGTPEFAVPSLRALAENGYEVVALVTQPDRPVGRKQTLTPPPAKVAALELGIPVYQFERIRKKEAREQIEALKPDLFVTAAFGQILSQRVLDVPSIGTINVHASLLPQYRGSAPINWCIIRGETQTGVTTMFTDAGIDTGDMLLQETLPILPDDTTQTLGERLSHLGAKVLLNTLTQLKDGTLKRIPQEEAAATYYPMLDKDMAQMDFTKPAAACECLVRGLQPWPIAFFTLDGQNVKVFKARVCTEQAGQPGCVLSANPKEGLLIACGENALSIEEMQFPGGKRLAAKEYLRGKSIPVGSYVNELQKEI